jgi:adenosylhomocysteine nucleosidase
MRIGIIAALPGELKPLVRGWQALPVVKGSGVRMWQRPESAGADEVVAACAGMGAAAARRAFSAVEFGGALDAVYSIGWAGAATGEFKAEACWVVSGVVDAQTGERFECSVQDEAKVLLVTTAHVAGESEKRRLWESYGAGMVDMEAATVARLAQMRGIPFACVKAISDEHDADLPDLNPFIDVHGQLEMGRFLRYILFRPMMFPALMRLGVHSGRAAKSLRVATETLLANGDIGRG